MNNKKPVPGSRNTFLFGPFWMAGIRAAAAKEEHPVAPKEKNTGLKGIVAGGITGGIEICITYPTEYVKTHLQLDEKHRNKQYDGIFDCVKKTIHKHGFLGLYRGLSVLIYGSIPKSGVRFGTFEKLKTYMADDRGILSPRDRVFCGLGAGVSEALFAVTPMETIKVKFINDRRSPNPKYKSFLQGVTMIIKEEGIKGVYQGVTPTVLKQGSNQAVRFYVMETLKNWYREEDQAKHIPKYVIGAFGIFAGACSVMANTPLDVVKTRMQGLEAHNYKNTLDCIAKVWRHEGVTAFYKGTVPRLSRVCLDVCISFVLYESFIELFNKFWP